MCATGSAKSQTRSPLAHTSLKFLRPGESEKPPVVRLKCGSCLQEEKAQGMYMWESSLRLLGTLMEDPRVQGLRMALHLRPTAHPRQTIKEPESSSMQKM